ncbi:MAG: HAMP domain-containing sensor histidine kinase, partial [Oscillospiraceae bacterium]
EVPSEETSMTLSPLPPDFENQTSAFFHINADTAVAIPAQNLTAATNPATGTVDSIAVTPSYSLVRFGNLVGSAILQAIPVVLTICVVISALCALVFSRIIASPIRKISAATEEMSALTPDALCPVSSGDEIGALAEHVNSLYGSLLSNIQSLEEEKQRVEESEKSKIDFLRSASHELKTPVTALNAMLENMMLGVGKYKDTAHYLPRCKEMCDRLSLMIRDILEASRLQSAEVEEAPVATDLRPFLEKLCAPYEELAALDGLDFSLDVTGTATLPTVQFSKALSNVLGNAVAYTPAGGRVAVSCDGQTLTVFNSCTPIPEENLAHIFEAFYRPDWSRNRQDGGNGLGLYITAGILEKLGYAYTFAPAENGAGMIFSLRFISP